VRTYPRPRRWLDGELEAGRRDAIADFIAERTAAGNAAYAAALESAVARVAHLFHVTNDLLDLDDAAALVEEPGLIDTIRYVVGPPISADDLATVADVARSSGQAHRRLTLIAHNASSPSFGPGWMRHAFPGSWVTGLDGRRPRSADRPSTGPRGSSRYSGTRRRVAARSPAGKRKQ
jgi:hypothetical protein